MRFYVNRKSPSYPQCFMAAFQFSILAIGFGLALKHPETHKPIFSISLCFYKWSITLGINGYLD